MRVSLAILLLTFASAVWGAEPVAVSQLYGQESAAPQPTLPLTLESTLIMREQTEIRRARIYMQDIASCQGSVLLCRDILAIDLGPSPKAGHEKSLTEADLRKALDLELPQQKVLIQAPSRMRLIATALPVDAARIRQLVEARLPELDGPYRFTLNTVRVPVGLRLRHGNYRIEFPSWEQDFSFIRQNPRRSLVNLMVRLIDQEAGSSEHYDLTVQVVLRAEVKAAVVVQAMERGQLLNPEAVDFQWVPYQENVVRDASALEKQILRLTARPGQVLRNYDLVRDPDVKRGERVEAYVVSNGVKMNSAAQAMESAAIGQRIRVKLATTKRQVMATVTGPSKVEVHMP
ncbi:flagellar basal body P-ring formation chaperone FlgA [Oligoflexus tunisiensis]|uniref:flagellar basal body P-ring formation chaperone FlgA n=1 Tax=Oligoflexus tunisiensis TaxID=708132 RepID=UPI00114D391D|nr:flagellar basal body P-ring formation chaperone FlgA [Oligoflexus tunisiensis]